MSLERLLLEIEQQATRKNRACDFKKYLITDLEIIEKLVKKALKQVWNECAQEQVENLTIPIVTQRSEQFSLKQLWIMAQKYNQSDFVQMVTEVEKLNCG